jgi:penicillin-binding protein 2
VRRRRIDLVDPRALRPRLADLDRLPSDAFGPRSVAKNDLKQPWNPRLVAFYVAAIAVFVALAYILYSLQIRQGAHFNALAEANSVRQEVVRAPRGVLFDRHGTQLVTNRPISSLAVVPINLPKQGPDRAAVMSRLSRGSGLPEATIESEVAAHATEPFQPFVLQKNLSPDAYGFFTENLPQMPGVRIITDSARNYLDGSGLSHLLGYVGKLDAQEYSRLNTQGYLLDDSVGKTGLEYVDEKYLRGTPGKDVVEVDARGQVVRHISTSDPIPGNNVYLTIDWKMQQMVAAQLQAGIDKARKAPNADVNLIHGGAAIVSNPQTGEIYAMVSLPDYNLNQFAGGITDAQYMALVNDTNSPLLNRATSGLYPPGSTFKPVVAAGALQSGVITPASLIFDPGHYTRGGFTFYGWNRSGFGNQNLVQAIAHSDDIFFYEAARRLGDLNIATVARDFGVGRRTGIDLGPEAAGIAPDRNWKKAYFADAFKSTHDPAWLDSAWYGGNTITYGIGQSYLLVTPLQDLEWLSTVANGGNYMRPQLTGRITGVDGTPMRPFQPVVDHHVSVSSQWLSVVRDGLRAAVDLPSGTAYYPLHSLGVPVAGKTGTAQFGVADAHGNTPAHAWFSAYGPADNPEVAVTVFIEAGGEGSSYALPVADQILQYYFAHRAQIRAN